jgi:hypothetical protein
MTTLGRSRPLVERIASITLCALASGFPGLGSSRAAGVAEHWVATSTTAISVTGNVTFAPDKMTFQAGPSLPLALVGHVAAFQEMGETVDATVYRVTAKVDPRLKNGNHLCGSPGHGLPVTYIAVWAPDPLPGDKAPRSMAAFSSKDPPRSAGGATSCGVYNYDAGG